MEKKVVILLTVMTIVINIFSFLHINQNTIDKILYDKTTISFDLYTGKDLSDVLLKINEFSKNISCTHLVITCAVNSII